MQLWPKAALLILITLWFGFVHAASGPLGEARTALLRERLTNLYATGESSGEVMAAIENDRFTSLAVVPHLLSHVLAHADDPSPKIQDLNAHLVGWAARLALDEGPRHDLEFVMNQLHRQLGRLLDRYGDDADFRTSLLLMFEKLELWGPAQLPFLARAAGDDDEFEAQAFGIIARNLLHAMADHEAYLALTADMAKTIRAVTDVRPWQWALLSLSGHITEDELSTILLLVSHEYAADVVPPSIASLQVDSPLSAVIKHLMEGYAEEVGMVEDAFQMAMDESESLGSELTPQIIRRTFFENFANGTLFGDEPTPNKTVAATNRASSAAVTPKVNPVLSSLERDGNVIRARFGAKSTCGDEFE